MQNIDAVSASILDIKNEVQKSKGLVSETKSTIIPRVKQFDALFLDTQVKIMIQYRPYTKLIISDVPRNMTYSLLAAVQNSKRFRFSDICNLQVC